MAPTAVTSSLSAIRLARGSTPPRCATAVAPVRRPAIGRALLESSARLSSVRSEHQGLAIRLTQSVRTSRSRQTAQSPQASFLGVGAPEAFVVAVVALLVFGPKGLAEVAKSVGKTLRSFQPTIQELQSVSREFQTALKEEIYADDKAPAAAPAAPPAPLQPPVAQEAANAAKPAAVPPLLSTDTAPTKPASTESAPKQ